MTVRLGEDVHDIGPGTFVHVPAGLPHRNWNNGTETETHLEVLVPATRVGASIAFPVESADEVPDADKTQRAGAVVVVAGPGGSAASTRLIDPESGSDHAVVDYKRVRASIEDTHLLMAGSDRFYFVVAGRISVVVGLERRDVGPEDLVIAPAGVPHAIRAIGGDAEYLLVAAQGTDPAPMQRVVVTASRLQGVR